MGSAVVPAPFRMALMRRAAGLWLLVRAGILAIGLLPDLGTATELTFLTRPAGGFAVLLVVWLAMFEARRRGETLFLANLGVIWMTGGTTHALGRPADARSHDQFRREYLVAAAG